MLLPSFVWKVGMHTTHVDSVLNFVMYCVQQILLHSAVDCLRDPNNTNPIMAEMVAGVVGGVVVIVVTVLVVAAAITYHIRSLIHSQRKTKKGVCVCVRACVRACVCVCGV